MNRFVISLAYDGSAFQGWQKQLENGVIKIRNGREVRTVQSELERALREIAKEPIRTIGSSRTDAGVHALNQYAHFDFPVDMTTEQIRLALTSKLSKDIRINKVYCVDDDFHTRFCATGRSYRFVIARELTPFNRNYKSYFPRFTIDQERIQKCLPLFLGEHDFEFFCQKSEELKTFVSVVSSVDFYETEEDCIFEISADRFLHNMVRRIIGTLVRLSGREEVGLIIEELLKRNRKYLHLVYTAPPQGLYLVDVHYAEGYFSTC